MSACEDPVRPVGRTMFAQLYAPIEQNISGAGYHAQIRWY